MSCKGLTQNNNNKKQHWFNSNLSKPLKCQIVWAPIRPEQSVGPDLGPNRLQMLSADDMSSKVLMQKVKYNGFDPELSEPFDVKNNLDPGRATMVVFPDTMYTYMDTQGGSKLTTFSHI